ncbi:MAG TPA: APC family permease [Acidimicrobiales bacterium]|nr:APC family permease [Acidimicrobiales bacterium]
MSVEPKAPLQPLPSRPKRSRRYESPGYRAKRVLLGPALRTSELAHERITKRVALAVFSSDPISSTAYATEEILLVLVGGSLAGGALATGLALPVALAIVALLALLVVSYRQVVDAYPSAGGAYVVSRDNFGNVTAAVAGAALLIDYVLTVAVSVSSGVAAMASVFPDQLGPLRVELSVAFVLLLAWGNLRGIREAGKLFAIPTYVYVVSVGAMILAGAWRLATGNLQPIHYTPAQTALLHHEGAVGAVTVFLVLRAFASGTTALTGVEAISNGVSAFRAPEAANAKKTLMVMAAIMGSLFLGVTYLAVQLEARPFESGYPTVISQIARQVLGNGPAFILVQAATLLILVLAANTSFSGFPLLASFAAGDALLPRQLRKRGHRLVYSNGILALSAAAIFLIVTFKADVHALIPLYAVGVVLSFTLSQAGMTRRHLRLREPGWRSGMVINGVGAVVTGVALVVIIVGKFTEGAFIVVIAIPLLVWLLLRIQHTYGRELAQLKVEASHRLAPPKPRHEVVVLVEDLDQAALSALQYARQLNPLSITALHIAVDPDHARELARLWAKVHIPIPLELVDAPDRNLPATVEETVAEMVRPDTEVTVLVPRRRYVGFWRRVLHDQTSAELTKVLGELDNVNVTIVPFRLRRRGGLTAVPSSSP